MRKECLERFPCFFYGGGMARQPEDSLQPEKWEAGTPDAAGILGLYAAVKYLRDMGWEELLKREKVLAHTALSQLAGCNGYQILAAQDSPVISLIPEFFSSYDLGVMLNASGFDVRAGDHCAREAVQALVGLLHSRGKINGREELGVDQHAAGSCRISLSFYNTEEEIRRLIDFLRDLKERTVGQKRKI